MRYLETIRHFFFLILISFLNLGSGCSADPGVNGQSDLNDLKLQNGFLIEIYADDIESARAMAIGDKGTVFVGSRSAGKVYALVDNNKDYKIDQKITVDEGLQMPVGVTLYNGDLYVSAVSKILRYDNIEDNLNNLPEPVVVSSAFPTETHHGWKFIDFGPDGKLYVPVGAPCNICEEDPEVYATIMRMNPDGSALETFARGIRNTVGFDWHPVTGDLWFTDNGRDWLGDELPPCELNKATEKNMHFGYPYCHGTDVSDPEFGEKRNCSEFVAPEWNFGAHTAPLGMCFYKGNMFPERFKNQILVALHGSWNRSTKIGYEVLLVTLTNNQTANKAEKFVSGFEDKGDVTGRPVDILELPDGSVLISDDHSNKIYRVTYKK